MKKSSATYMVSVDSLISQKVPLILRNRDNAYKSHREYRSASAGERAARFEAIVKSIKENGFREKEPIIIQLRRKNGKDKIKDGHHRFAAAKLAGLSEVPIRFAFE